MSTSRTRRDLEHDYLSLSYQLEDLLQRRAAVHSLNVELEATHRQMVSLARRIAGSADAREAEYDYLAAVYKVQDLLQQKSRTYNVDAEFVAVQKQLEETAALLGWDGSQPEAEVSPQTDAEFDQQVSALQREIQELRTVLV